MTTRTTKPKRPTAPLAKRLERAQEDLRTICNARPTLDSAEWLRSMAAARREVAAVYRDAAREHPVDSVEWSALIDAAMMLDIHASANEAHADEADGGKPAASAQPPAADATPADATPADATPADATPADATPAEAVSA